MTYLRHLREARGLTLKIVAAAVSTDPGNLSRIERGAQFPSRELARAIASYYDVSIEEVMFPPEESNTAVAAQG